MQFELPNSPGVPITVERGGVDPASGDTLPDQWVQLTWQRTWTDPDGTEHTTTERRGFLGP